jgi:hypothetical protein
MDEETVMFDIEGGKYFSMDPVGSEIWQRIESPIKVSELCAQLTQVFEVDQERCESDVIRFLEELLENKLIEIC